MQDNVQKEEGGVSLIEILRLLLSKIKLLILVVIAAGIAGGSFGLWRSWNDLYFGTKVEFYVNPEKPRGTGSEGASQYGVYGAYGRHVMDNMVKLLESESFTEQLLLNGKALPDIMYVGVAEDDPDYPVVSPFGEVIEEGHAWSWVSTKDPAWAELNAALNNAKTARAAANDKTNVTPYDAAVVEKAEQTKVYNNLSNEFDKEWLSLALTQTDIITDTSFNEEIYNDIISDPTLANSDTFKRLIMLFDKKAEAEGRINSADEAIVYYQTHFLEEADKAEKLALDLWRATPGYKATLNSYSNAVSFSYLEANADIEDANNLARSFIYVDVSVVGEQNQDFAKELLKRVKDVVPVYVEANMTIPADYQGTNCQRITRTDEIARTNPNHRTTQAIKFALLFAAASFVVACVIIILIDKSDKRLRDTEVITKKFNVPILGIVPTIEELNEEVIAKKLAAKHAKSSSKETK